MSSAEAALVWCPFPDRDSARDIASRLLDENLIACANIVGEIESIFEYNGERGTGIEIGVLFKTRAVSLDKAIVRLGELHPYDTPAIIGWRCDGAHPSTLEWLAAITG